MEIVKEAFFLGLDKACLVFNQLQNCWPTRLLLLSKLAIGWILCAALLDDLSFANETVPKSENEILSQKVLVQIKRNCINSLKIGAVSKSKVRPASVGGRGKTKSSAARVVKSMLQLCSLVSFSIFYGLFLL